MQAPKPRAVPDPAPVEAVPPPAAPADTGVPPARPMRRHRVLAVSFVLCVALPVAAVFFYLYTRAADQYASTAAFSIRQEDGPNPVELIGGLTKLSRGGSSDTDILYDFIGSQRLVEIVDSRLDLRALFARPHARDPWFALAPDASIEALRRHWERAVRVTYRPETRIIAVEVLAFSAEDARAVARAVLEESDALVNDLSRIAQDDAIRFAREERDRAVERLKAARVALSRFRQRMQVVDPRADVQGQMGVITALEQQLAEAMIERDLLAGVTRATDPRMAQADRRIAAIRDRIAGERAQVGSEATGPAGTALSQVVGDYEALLVEQEFAEQSYVAALAAYDSALAEAGRQSRYLAAHISPTLAERPEYPRRAMIGAVTAMFALLIWVLMALVVYSVRDRR